ncbi:uncharacterized protein A1O9_08439 [Exophiala aquamarina CBS 119918]|uniref:Uncharacterized protein n=1 Tax=Exophiala aquamarina CBS 119918 TaxID=1182545 RepID=A0A072P6E6_9EURO|nr:uncharacterized protein A1O9_08439 [Exophiala aquamarina CBS 119918]KEF55689.1 hypothetical protein A1O9_08439 [Exophiala aquamarina CBS 119918]
MLIFNYSNALMTPLYLAFHLATVPSVDQFNASGFLVDSKDLDAILWSYLFGYLFPLAAICLAPSGRTRLKLGGVYQQWNLFITASHYISRWFLGFIGAQDPLTVQDYQHKIRLVYGVAFALAAIPHWVSNVIFWSAALWPRLFNPNYSASLHPRETVLPPNPFSSRQSKDTAEGCTWLIQWDNIIGTAAAWVWALKLFLDAHYVIGSFVSFLSIFLKSLLYISVGGPMGLPIGLMWERDEILSSLAFKSASAFG